MAKANTPPIGNQRAQTLGPGDDDGDDEEGLQPAAAQLGPTFEEQQEELIERENALAAREARLIAQEARMEAMMARLERVTAGTKTPEDEAEKPVVLLGADGKPIPQLDMDMPYGTVIGDPEAGYVQNGHRFAKDRRYLCDEPRGTGKPFNIKMLGLVKVVSKAA